MPDVDNPLFEEWRRVHGSDAPYGYRHRMLSNELLDGSYTARWPAIERWSFAVPGPEALSAIAELGPITELGCGTGYWASLLSELGVDVLAFDQCGPDWRRWFPCGAMWGGVAVGGVEKAFDAGVAGRTLFLCWPSYGEPFALDALSAFEAGGGKTVVYVGEGLGGCTADGNFHYRLGLGSGDDCWECREEPGECAYDGEHPTAGWELADEIAIPQWFGINDSLYVFERL